MGGDGGIRTHESITRQRFSEPPEYHCRTSPLSGIITLKAEGKGFEPLVSFPTEV